MQEYWKDIIWYEWLYQVSNLWSIKSLNYNRTHVERILKPSYNTCGYLHVWLQHQGKRKIAMVHRLVCEAFIKNLESKSQVNHINGIKSDNRLENLEWVTPSENIQHCYHSLWYKNHFQTNHPRSNNGVYWSQNTSSKSIVQLSMLGVFIKEWWSIIDVQRMLWISQWSISNCCKWKYWYKSAWWYTWQYT